MSPFIALYHVSKEHALAPHLVTAFPLPQNETTNPKKRRIGREQASNMRSCRSFFIIFHRFSSFFFGFEAGAGSLEASDRLEERLGARRDAGLTELRVHRLERPVPRTRSALRCLLDPINILLVGPLGPSRG